MRVKLFLIMLGIGLMGVVVAELLFLEKLMI
ncbi:hypothetical protein M2102_002813 [Fusobacterium sp. PH5-7]|nr:hypothetical protein [Fusobacterium sp. PH5-7]